MIRNLFIDFDDTLYDTRGNAEISLYETFDYFHWEDYFEDKEKFMASYWKTNVELWESYAKGEISRDYLMVERFRRPLSEGVSAGVSFNPSAAYCLQVSDVFLKFCASKSGVVEGAHELMAYLKNKGYRLHMCSNGFHEVQYKKLRSCGLLSYFDTIILSEDAGANKPNPIFFNYAFEKTGAAADDTMMIGDNFNTDILGAKNSGIRTIFFNRNPQFRQTEETDYEVSSLKEIKNIL